MPPVGLLAGWDSVVDPGFQSPVMPGGRPLDARAVEFGEDGSLGLLELMLPTVNGGILFGWRHDVMLVSCQCPRSGAINKTRTTPLCVSR